MKDELAWFETAKAHLHDAIDSLNNGNYRLAYQEALLCGEILLKAVLEKNNKFTHEDMHHNITGLLRKIKSEQCLRPNMLNQIEDIIINKGFDYIDVTSNGGSHQDSPAVESPKLRYPIDGSPPNELFDHSDALKKINQAKQLIKIISQIF